jgi:hypothetical protein
VCTLKSEISQRKVKTLRDTGCHQSLVLKSLFPEEAKSSCKTVILRPIGDALISVPLIRLTLKSDLVSGKYDIGLVDALPHDGIVNRVSARE